MGECGNCTQLFKFSCDLSHKEYGIVDPVYRVGSAL